jgi:hypothetical protein
MPLSQSSVSFLLLLSNIFCNIKFISVAPYIFLFLVCLPFSCQFIHTVCYFVFNSIILRDSQFCVHVRTQKLFLFRAELWFSRKRFPILQGLYGLRKPLAVFRPRDKETLDELIVECRIRPHSQGHLLQPYLHTRRNMWRE